MTRTVVVVSDDTPFKEIVRKLHDYRVSAMPVLSDGGCVIGVVSEDDLLLKEDPGFDGERSVEGRRHRSEREKAHGVVARELMTSPAITIGPSATHREAARLMHRSHVKRLPVVDERGRVLGIVSRADLLRVFLRDDAAIRREVAEDVIGRALWLDPDAFRVSVRGGIVNIDGHVERRSLVTVLFECVRTVDGVVAVDGRVTWGVDDLQLPDVPLLWAGMGSAVRW